MIKGTWILIPKFLLMSISFGLLSKIRLGFFKINIQQNKELQTVLQIKHIKKKILVSQEKNYLNYESCSSI